jgi:hypothetical protein
VADVVQGGIDPFTDGATVGVASIKASLEVVKAVKNACSFAADTLIDMADSSVKAIADIKIGDKVLSADPATGVIMAEPVTALHSNDDHNLLDLTIHTPTGTTTIHTTTNHPFYDTATNTWTPAANLTPGHHLRTTTGQPATITAATPRSGHAQMYNLTINDLHTYFIVSAAAYSSIIAVRSLLESRRMASTTHLIGMPLSGSVVNLREALTWRTGNR